MVEHAHVLNKAQNNHTVARSGMGRKIPAKSLEGKLEAQGLRSVGGGVPLPRTGASRGGSSRLGTQRGPSTQEYTADYNQYLEEMRSQLMATLAKVEGDLDYYQRLDEQASRPTTIQQQREASRQSSRPPTGASKISAGGTYHRGYTPLGAPTPRPATVSPYPWMGHVTTVPSKLPPKEPEPILPMSVNGLPRTPHRTKLFLDTKSTTKLIRASVPFAGNGGDGEPSRAGEVRWVALSKQRVDSTDGQEEIEFQERFKQALEPAQKLWAKRATQKASAERRPMKGS